MGPSVHHSGIYWFQAESIEQREVLLREMAETTAATARESVTTRDQKTSRAEELQTQVSISTHMNSGGTSEKVHVKRNFTLYQ